MLHVPRISAQFVTATLIVIMSIFPGSFSTSSFVEVLQALVNTKQTGYLKMKQGDEEGFLAVENGVIVNARNGTDTALPALFQFVSWREATFDFHERPMPADLTRDLAVYDAQVLITGVAYKVDELNMLHHATPRLDAVLTYVGGSALGSIEVSASDLGMLSLADGHRTVRDIAEKVMLSPSEVARNLARFRLLGVLEEVASKVSRAQKSALAAAG